MFWFEVSSIFDSIRPVYRSGRFIGIFLETVDFEHQILLRTTRDQIVLVLCVLLDVYALSLSVDRAYSVSDSILLNSGIYCSVNLGFIISLAIPLCNRLFGQRMFGIFKTLAHVDTTLEGYGYRLNHQLNHLLSCIYMMIPIAINLLMMVTTFAVSNDPTSRSLSYPEIVIYLRSSLVFTIFGSYVCLTLTSIWLRFRGLHEVISKQFPTSRLSNVQQLTDANDPAAIVSSLQCFAELHERLCESILDFNYCFALQILFMLASAFGYTLFSIFGIIHELSQPAKDETHRVRMNNMVYGCIYLSFIIQVVVIGSITTSQVKKTAVVVHKVFCYGHHDLTVVRQLRHFSKQLIHNAPKVSCLLYDFEWPFLVSVMASLFMHIVILVQFDLSNIASNVAG